MNVKNFFDFRSQLLSSTFQVHAEGLKKDESGTNNHWNLIKGKYVAIDFPVIFKQECGFKFTDVLDTGWPSLYLISEKLKCILEENELTGWQTFSVKIYQENEKEIAGYYGLSIIGRCSVIRYDNCEIVARKIVPEGPVCRFYKGVCIDNWDGSDFFTPEGTYETLITERAANAIKAKKNSNIKLIRLSDIETDIDFIEKH